MIWRAWSIAPLLLVKKPFESHCGWQLRGWISSKMESLVEWSAPLNVIVINYFQQNTSSSFPSVHNSTYFGLTKRLVIRPRNIKHKALKLCLLIAISALDIGSCIISTSIFSFQDVINIQTKNKVGKLCLTYTCCQQVCIFHPRKDIDMIFL